MPKISIPTDRIAPRQRLNLSRNPIHVLHCRRRAPAPDLSDVTRIPERRQRFPSRREGGGPLLQAIEVELRRRMSLRRCRLEQLTRFARVLGDALAVEIEDAQGELRIARALRGRLPQPFGGLAPDSSRRRSPAGSASRSAPSLRGAPFRPPCAAIFRRSLQFFSPRPWSYIWPTRIGRRYGPGPRRAEPAPRLLHILLDRIATGLLHHCDLYCAPALPCSAACENASNAPCMSLFFTASRPRRYVSSPPPTAGGAGAGPRSPWPASLSAQTPPSPTRAQPGCALCASVLAAGGDAWAVTGAGGLACAGDAAGRDGAWTGGAGGDEACCTGVTEGCTIRSLARM